MIPEIDYLYDSLKPIYSMSKLKLINEESFKHKMKMVHSIMELVYFSQEDVWFNEVELAIAFSMSELSIIVDKCSNMNAYTTQSVRIVREVPKLLRTYHNDSILVPIEVDNVMQALTAPIMYLYQDNTFKMPNNNNLALLTKLVREVDLFGQYAYRMNEYSIKDFVDDWYHDVSILDLKIDKLLLNESDKKKLVLKRLIDRYKLLNIEILKNNEYYYNQYNKLGSLLEGIYSVL